MNNEQIDDDEDDKEQNTVVPAGARISFLKKNTLERTQKKLARSVDKAILYLETVVLDDKADPKSRLDAAKFIVTATKDYNESISRDQLARLVSESKQLLLERSVGHPMKNAGSGSADTDGEDSTPRYMPNIVLDASSISSM